MRERVRRVIRTVTSSIDLRYLGTLFVVVPLITPHTTIAPTETAAAREVVVAAPITSLTEEIVSTPQRQLSLPVVLAAEPVRRQATTIPAAPKRPVEQDPGLATKRVWAQKAAAVYQIDWKILEAVWQVESGKRWQTAIRSYAGAQGPCQFMPGTWRAYAQDGSGDGVKDVTYAPDCLFGAAKLLAANGAASGNVTRALLRYNNSMSYVQKVVAIANSIDG